MTGVDAVATEIRRLHAEFERCFHGDGDFDMTGVGDALADDFTLFPPNGARATRQEVLAGLHDAFGSRRITIRIESPEILWRRGDVVLAAYEEWHDRSDAPSTARRSTVLLAANAEAPGGFRWHHVQETWMVPPAR